MISCRPPSQHTGQDRVLAAATSPTRHPHPHPARGPPWALSPSGASVPDGEPGVGSHRPRPRLPAGRFRPERGRIQSSAAARGGADSRRLLAPGSRRCAADESGARASRCSRRVPGARPWAAHGEQVPGAAPPVEERRRAGRESGLALGLPGQQTRGDPGALLAAGLDPSVSILPTPGWPVLSAPHLLKGPRVGWRGPQTGHPPLACCDLPCKCMLSRFSPVGLFATLWTVAHQAPLSMKFSRQEYWSGLSCPSRGSS